jgi:hypothetical protein
MMMIIDGLRLVTSIDPNVAFHTGTVALFVRVSHVASLIEQYIYCF